MIYENGYDDSMTKEEAKASVEDMGKMMEYFEAPCEACGVPNKDCECMGEIELERKLKAEQINGSIREREE